MSDFVEQFCAGIADWSVQTGESSTDVCVFIMAVTGGSKFLEPELYYDPSALTVADVKKWLEQLLTMTHMAEEFLVYSLIKAYEAVLEDQFENAAHKSQRIREATAHLREEMGDPRGEFDKVEALAALTPEKLRMRRIQRDAWREVFTPIVTYIGRGNFL